MQPHKWLSDKILQSRFYKWLVILTTLVGLLVGITALIDWIGDNFISNSIRQFVSPRITIEQTIDPKVLKDARDSGKPLRIEKGITVYPKEK